MLAPARLQASQPPSLPPIDASSLSQLRSNQPPAAAYPGVGAHAPATLTIVGEELLPLLPPWCIDTNDVTAEVRRMSRASMTRG